jgi:hypothetical protein
MHSQSHFTESLNLRRNGDFWQQIGKAHSPTRRNGVICPPISGAMCMSRKALTREVVLAAILDVVMASALLTGTLYVAGICLAVAGN